MAVASSNKTFGLTSAITYEYPTKDEIVLEEKLKKVLQSHAVFESQDQTAHRQSVLAKLNELVQSWTMTVAKSKNIPTSAAEKFGTKIYTFGSFRLGVHNPDADIDALVVAPFHIERKDFFTSFVKVLQNHPEVKKCNAVTEAYVPVIKFDFEGIEMDLLFARLNLKEIPANFNINDNNLLRNMNVHCVRSINGSRVNETLLKLVPNVHTFQLALRCIKLWAKSRGIYSNSLGFLGGITWAIMVARICQLYPNASSAVIVNRFFKIILKWIWPMPLLLKKVDDDFLGLPVWDPRVNMKDGYHLMPIVTPAYPAQNTTFNVNMSSFKVIHAELRRGLDTVDEIFANKSSWSKLFEPVDFIAKYKHFLRVDIESSNIKDHVEWSGLIESKLRQLVLNMEINNPINIAHINTKPYKISDTHTMWTIGIDFIKGAGAMHVDLTNSIRDFFNLIERSSFKIVKPGMIFDIKYINRKRLGAMLKDQLKPESSNRKRVLKSIENLIEVPSKRKC